MWGWRSSRTAAIGSSAAALLVCSVLPLAYMVADALADSGTAGGARWTALLLDARQRALLWNTALLGAGTALVSTLIGAPLGLVLARVHLRGTSLWRIALTAPLLLPPYVVALAWVYLGGRSGLVTRVVGHDLLSPWTYSLPGAVVVLSAVLFPLSMLATEVSVRRIDARLEEAALLIASPGRVLRRITFPLAAPGIWAAGLIIFVLAISEFGVPALLRVRVFTTEVFTAFAALYDFGRATLLAVPLLLLSAVVATAASAIVGDRLVTSRRAMGHAGGISLSGWTRSASVAVATVLALCVALPVAVLLTEALALDSPVDVARDARTAIVNSLLLATVSATVVVAIALWLGYARARAKPRLGRLTDVLFLVLFATPSTVMGVGLIALWNRPGPLGEVYATDAMLLLASLARFVPVAAVVLGASVRQVPEAHEEAAALSGAGWMRTMAHIVLPQTTRGLLAAWLIVFILAFGELGASILVAPPGETTLPIRVYTLIANAPSSHVAALALLQAVVAFCPLAAVALIVARREAR